MRRMVVRLFFLLVGFGLSVIGGVSLIAYLNFITLGYSYTEYFQFISERYECYLLPIGLIVIWSSIYLPYNGYYDRFS